MLTFDNDKCVGCGQCVEDCVINSLKLAERKAVLDGKCIRCGHCVAICPEGAVSLPEYDMRDVEEFRETGFRLEAATLLRAIKFRRSIRRFAERKIEREKLDSIIQAGRYTATGSNAQGCKFIVVQDELAVLKEMIWRRVEEDLSRGPNLAPELLKNLKFFIKMRDTFGIDYLFRNAPAVLYIAADSAVDAGLAAQNMELMAVAQGLGVMFNGYVVWLSSLNEKVLDWLGTGKKPIAASMLIGYPDVRYQRTAPRKPADVDWR